MRFLIISHAFHKRKDSKVFSYAPYVREMNLWLKYVDEVEIIAPIALNPITDIDLSYKHRRIQFNSIPSIEFTSVRKAFTSLFKIPLIFYSIIKACKRADHIHLRCPGNIGLLGCLVQMFFPKKLKTAKYAGNWNPNSKQPISYKLQKWILSNTFLTRNIQVLVYGEWKNQSKNIRPFFTASFYNSEKENIIDKDYSGILNFVFVGSLVKGKRPLLAIQIVEALHENGNKVNLDIYGEGILKDSLLDYVQKNKLEKIVKLKGNQSKEIIKNAYKKAHFSILPSQSEGWPKAIAEAMFFGVIPISTEVSCVPYMLDYGKRGILIRPNLVDATDEIRAHLKEGEDVLELISSKAINWSQNYTLDVFEKEILKLIN